MSASECSSAEDERRLRAQNASASGASKKHRPAAAAAAAAVRSGQSRAAFVPDAPASNHDDLVLMHQIPIGEIPRLRDLSQLIVDCKSLGQNIDGTPICELQRANIEAGQTRTSAHKRKGSPVAAAAAAAAAASSSSPSSPSVDGLAVKLEDASLQCEDDLTQALHAAVLAGQPDLRGHWVADEFHRLLAQLPLPEFYDPAGLCAPVSQDHLQTQLQRQQYFLPVQKASLETQLLAESGVFVSKKSGKEFYFPPCRNGEKCVGMTHRLRLQSRPFVFMMIMFEHEYEYFCKTGRPPKASRPCVQCTRHHMTAMVVFDRSVRMCGEAQADDSVLPLQRSAADIRQFYQNLCNQPGGYHRIHMLLSNHSPDDPVLEPICMPGRSVIFCRDSTVLFNKETNRPRLVVDQSAIVWTAPAAPQPHIGHNLLSFYGGASKC